MKKLLWLTTLVALLTVSAPLSAAAGVRPPLVPRLLLIVAGQSNATGWRSYAVDPTTGIDYLAPPFTNGADAVDTMTIYGITPFMVNVPLDTPQQVTGGPVIFGPEIGLARTVYAETGQPVTIVKVTYPATAIVEWGPGTLLRNQIIKCVHRAVAADKKHGYLDTIGGFYWVQGEADAEYPPWAETYEPHLVNLIDHIRHALKVPALPVVLAKESIAATCNGAIACLQDDELVRDSDRTVAATLPDVSTVDTLGLARTSDNLHLTNVSELTLGAEMATSTP